MLFAVVGAHLLLFTVTTEGVSQGNPRRTLLALSKADHTLAIVDPVTLKVMGKVPVGSDPHEVIASADGKMAYVSITGGGKSFEMNAIDLVAQKALPNIDTRPLIGPHGLAFEGGKVWFSAEGARAVGSYDPASGKIDWSMGTGQDRTHMIYVTPDIKRIYTTNVNAGTVSILADTLLPPPTTPTGAVIPGAKPRQDWVQTVIQVGPGAEGFDVSPDGKQLWTAAARDGSIWIIDLTGKKVTAKLDANVKGANRLKFTPDGKRVLVSCLGMGDLFVFDAQSHKEVKRIPIGRGAAGILVDPDGGRAFLGCTPDNYVAVVDLKKLEMIGKIDVGDAPDGLAWAVKN
ncbi:MAG: YncE family protein [Bacteroidetes bacterium]|nr:YncE family protein [Bacteroidota bacterium]